jgi:hypothetical protein
LGSGTLGIRRTKDTSTIVKIWGLSALQTSYIRLPNNAAGPKIANLFGQATYRTPPWWGYCPPDPEISGGSQTPTPPWGATAPHPVLYSRGGAAPPRPLGWIRRLPEAKFDDLRSDTSPLAK